VRMLAETLAGLNAVFVHHPQRAKSHLPRVAVRGEGKRVVGIEPAVIGVTPVV
jgi:hypothetical protein